MFLYSEMRFQLKTACSSEQASARALKLLYNYKLRSGKKYDPTLASCCIALGVLVGSSAHPRVMHLVQATRLVMTATRRDAKVMYRNVRTSTPQIVLEAAT